MSSWDPPKLTFLITGCSSGFGLALTRLALSHSHTVIATGRNPSALPPALVAEVESHASNGSRFLALDVDSPTRAAELVEQLECRDDGVAIDVLVNNAGWSVHGPAESFREDEVRRQFETVFFGPYRLARAVAPHMRRRRRGMIVNIGSGAGVDGRESMAVYAAAKAALDGLMRVMAKELAPFNIRSLTVQLGGFDTNFTRALTRTAEPFPDDYAGSMVEKVLGSIEGANFQPDGDHRKAARAIYEVIVGEGVGRGKEAERVLPLGRDMGKMMDRVADATKHSMDTFRDVCDNVYLEKK
ncbi:hypothetical protein PCL_09665 [Purpureocillium lilacinum]|uniref:Retinol dehydrogenase 8 n=1 Tax=Purpureocillium lilacinum TaxID=33203 RepID=A0A2U3EDX8_PURLI|nr:hypothetical protein PCL_09665 [Purpureocillium lilacinum]